MFWNDAVNWQGGSWQGDDAFVEIQLEYETRASWNPLNQNALSRNYNTVLLLHTFQDDRIQQRPIASYPGWTLNGSLFLAGNYIIAQRGVEGGYGTERRELIAVRLDAQSPEGNEPRVLVDPATEDGMHLVAAFPSPDGRRIAAVLTRATMTKPTGEIFVDFFDFTPDGEARPVPPRVAVAFEGAPGLPGLAWKPDGSILYLQRTEAVLALQPGDAQPFPAASFPGCFRPTRTGHNISESGRFFFREQDGSIATRKEAWLPYDRIPVINRIDKIGAGCP